MSYGFSTTAFIVFFLFVGVVLGLSFYLGRKAKSASGYYAAHGQINWFVNGIAFAGDYLSAASFLGICGMIAFFGYDGFLYSIGYLAGWVVALFVIAEPLKRMGRFTFADALDSKFNSRGIQLTAAISTLLVSIFYLIPQMVGAGVLVQPLLGFSHLTGVVIVGIVVILIVTTAGMVSTTWVQFIKGSLLVIFCLLLVGMILKRGLSVGSPEGTPPEQMTGAIKLGSIPFAKPENVVTPTGDWAKKNYLLLKNPKTGETIPFAFTPQPSSQPGLFEDRVVFRAQSLTKKADGSKLVNGLPQGHGDGKADLFPVGTISKLPGDKKSTGALGPVEFLSTLQNSTVVTWEAEKKPLIEADGSETTVYFQKPVAGADLLQAGGSSTFKGVRGDKLVDKLDFISLMIALFCGTASLPHILIRYYTVKDGAAARKSTVVGIASIGFFYVLTLFLGLGAMTSGSMDPTNNNMAAPLLAKSFGELPFAIISAIAFTTVLGTVSGLIMAASGAVAHDLMTNVMGVKLDDHGKVKAGKIAAVVVGAIAMVLGVVFQKMNVTFLVGWAFNVAASANLPSLVMLLFWKKTTKQGITAAIIVGLVSSLGWLALTGPAYKEVYGWDPANAPMPFSQPGLVTIPLGFIVLFVVSLLTQDKERDQSVKPGFEVVQAK